MGYLLLKLSDFARVLFGFQLLSLDFAGQLSVLLGQLHDFGGGYVSRQARHAWTKEQPCVEEAAVCSALPDAHIPAKASRSSSLFLLRCLISNSFSLTSLKRRLFSSLSSLSWSCKYSFSEL